jgi:shikimate dehydrogenase
MTTFRPYQIYGVIGQPLGHSLSPLLHTTAFKALGIPAVLLPWPMSADQLPAFILSVRLLNIQGACVTIPHKIDIIPLLDEVTDRVKTMGAANLIYRRGDRICGDNTDILGFMSPLAETGPDFKAKTLILGAGGVARAVVLGLQTLGFTDITITDIAEDIPATLASQFNIQTVAWARRRDIPANLLINTTPLGMLGKFESETPWPADWFTGLPAGLVYDVVYSPLQTRLIKEAQAAGWATIGGLTMFLSQADHQFMTWTGGQHLPAEAKEAVAKHLGG